MVNILSISNDPPRVSRHSLIAGLATFALSVLPGVAVAAEDAAADTSASLVVSSAEYRVPVVELYTSEGCSSCPRADEWISKLGDYLNPELDAVPLAFHVDYWNYLGWEDPFSKPEFTKRQRFLGAINNQHSIYTPEFLVSGKETRGTSTVLDAIVSANDEPAQVAIEVILKADGENALSAMLSVDSRATEGSLYLAVYENDIVREIGAGENHGRTLHHDFVVRHWMNVADLKAGLYENTHRVAIGDDWNRDNLGFAAIVVDPRSSKTLQALRTDLAPLIGG